MSRLRSAVYGERSDLSNKVNRFNESVDEYSLNGSIKHLVRRGKKNDGEYGKIDNLHAYYDGNQLQRVEDNAIKLLYNGSMDFKDSGDSEVEYTYNDNGALTSDKNRGIALIEYDNCNNPRRVQFTNGNVTEYIYTATGQKLRTIHRTAISNITVPMGTTHTLTQNETQSIDSTDYLLAGTYRLTNGMRSMYLFPGGYCNLNDPTVTGTGNPSTDSISYHYYNKDHLGNNREVISENGQVEQIVHYYPFGTPFTDGSSTNIGLQPYLYGNKELDMMHGLNTYDFGARNYNPLLPMWDRVDPKASDYPWVSPFVYCLDNPIRLFDPDGEKPTVLEAALMAKHVYGDYSDKILIGGWMPSQMNVKGVNFNEEAIGLNSRLYQRTNDGVTEYAYVFAGTDLTDINDIIEDVQQGAGLSSPQYDKAAQNAMLLNDKLSKFELTFVGHSLGGGEAALSALVTDREAMIFNPAGVSPQTKSRHGVNNKSENNISAYILMTDPLNYAQDMNPLLPSANGTRYYISPKTFDSIIGGHFIDNVIESIRRGGLKQHDSGGIR